MITSEEAKVFTAKNRIIPRKDIEKQLIEIEEKIKLSKKPYINSRIYPENRDILEELGFKIDLNTTVFSEDNIYIINWY